MRLLGSWQRVRRAPFGVLALGAALVLLGAGFMLGGVYLAVSRPAAGWMPWAAALAVGPLLLYVALHLVRLSRWAWLALTALTALLLASALARLLLATRGPFAPLPELLVEAGTLAYLARPAIRRAFGRR